MAGLSPRVSGVIDLDSLGFKGREIADEDDVFWSKPFRNPHRSSSDTEDTSGVPRKHKVIFGTEIGFKHLQIRYINDRLAWNKRTAHSKFTTKDPLTDAIIPSDD